MPVNLEELALKSIEQYAALNVEIGSLKIAVTEMNRKAEIGQERFGMACDKLSRLEEKIAQWVDDRKLIHDRISDTRAEVDKLVELVRGLTENVKEHQVEHCDGCVNNDKIATLEDQVAKCAAKFESMKELNTKVENHIHGDKELNEVRRKITSPQGMMLMRWLTSKWGLWWIGLVSVASVLSFIMHYDTIKNIWAYFHLQG